MQIKDILRERRLELNMTMKDVAKKVGVNEGTISRWESGEISNMRRDKIALLAKTLKISPAVIMGWEDDTTTVSGILPIRKQRFPLLGAISCGEPKLAEEEHETFIEAAADIDADFCLQAKGDSMVGARIYDGDYVFVKSQSMVENGEIAAVVIDEEATLKRLYYYREKDLLILRAENPAYEDLIYTGAELDQINILGKAVFFQSDL